jgi:hypothetical protein
MRRAQFCHLLKKTAAQKMPNACSSVLVANHVVDLGNILSTPPKLTLRNYIDLYVATTILKWNSIKNLALFPTAPYLPRQIASNAKMVVWLTIKAKPTKKTSVVIEFSSLCCGNSTPRSNKSNALKQQQKLGGDEIYHIHCMD